MLLHDIIHIPTIGDVISAGGYEWRVVYLYDNSTKCVLMKEYWDEDVVFDQTESHNSYSGSNIANKCITFYNSLSNTAFKSSLISIKVHGITAKVWIPQSNWISDETPDSSSGTSSNVFSYFDYFPKTGGSSDERTFKDRSNVSHTWWTSSTSFDNYISCCGETGGMGVSIPTRLEGFRPFVAIPIIALP